jgi:hypothetical protein
MAYADPNVAPDNDGTIHVCRILKCKTRGQQHGNSHRPDGSGLQRNVHLRESELPQRLGRV